MALNGNNDEANGYNSVIKNGTAPDANLVKSVMPPIGSVVSWMKTFGTADSGTTDGTTSDKLVQSGQNFQTTIDIGMIVYNTTDDTFANVTAIDSDTTLSIDSDIMVSGETFVIYKTPKLPDGWVECDGSVLSDSDSPYNGETIPDLNSSIGDSNKGRFLRGHIASGLTEDSANLAHTHPIDYSSETGSGSFQGKGTAVGTYNSDSSGGTEARPFNYSVVFIMRIK